MGLMTFSNYWDIIQHGQVNLTFISVILQNESVPFEYAGVVETNFESGSRGNQKLSEEGEWATIRTWAFIEMNMVYPVTWYFRLPDTYQDIPVFSFFMVFVPWFHWHITIRLEQQLSHYLIWEYFKLLYNVVPYQLILNNLWTFEFPAQPHALYHRR